MHGSGGIRMLRTTAVVAALLASARGIARGQESAAAPANALQRGVRDRAELEAFVDGVMAGQLQRQHVAGATVAVVKDGALFFAKGYGYADVDKRQPVDPARTLFRIGSVSKLFTWTAVMQLQQEGKLDLDADVNRYLDFRIPATYPQPITLRHLLTHTPGFEDDSRDLIGDDPKQMVPLGRWVATHIPARVRPPGTYSSYSNYGATLAGYIVERVSGVPFETYIDQRILEPLGMQHATGRQPLPPQLAADMSQGYRFSDGWYESKKFEIVIPAPAGSMSASAADMAKFMLAHLGDGALGGRRILSDTTARLMHGRTFGPDPRIPGFALGFYEQSSHGLRIIGHGGDTQWFHSNLALMPSESLGVFVSYNTQQGGELTGPFLTAFLDHYYPTPPAVAVFPADAAARAARVAGVYQTDRRSYSTFLKAVGLAGGMTVQPKPDGSLIVRAGGDATRYVPVGPRLYREALGQDLLAFQGDRSGRVTHLLLGSEPMMTFEPVPWYESPRLHQVVLGVSALVFLGVVIAAASRLVRRRFGEPRPGDTLPGRWSVVGLAAANLAFVVVVVALSSDLEALLLGPATALKIALALPVIGAVLTLIALVIAVGQWRRRTGTTGARLRFDAVVVVALLFLWSLNQWNLLGWRM